MKIKCIKNYGYNRLTINKIYEVIRIYQDEDYEIIDDNGVENWYHKEWFKPLSELRNEKIDKLLN